MNSFLVVNKQTQSLAGIVAVAATLIVLGVPLTLAEYYAHNGSANHMAESALACQAVQAVQRKT
jgi:hypothetical protein